MSAGPLRILALALALTGMVLKRRLAYRADLLVQSLDELLRGMVALVILQVSLSHTRSLNGWTADQLLFILGFSLVPLALFHCFCGNLYQLSNRYIIQGEFDRVLLRPYPSFLTVCLDRIAIEDLSGAVLGCGMMAVAAARGAVDLWSWQALLLLGFLILCSFTVVLSVFMAFAASGFWFEDRVGMVPPVYNLMEFARYPVDIYHRAVRWFITCIIPFSFAAFYPASMFLAGPDDGHATRIALATPLVAAAALGLALQAWRSGVRRYGSTGS